ncbi:hypothetical protein, partial [Streptomyces rimosus]
MIQPPTDAAEVRGGHTLPEVFETASRAAPDAVAIVDGDRSRTWAQWRADVRALARGLQESGVG